MGVDSNVLTAKQGGRHLTPEEFHNVLEKSSPENVLFYFKLIDQGIVTFI